jgi:putative transport protein
MQWMVETLRHYPEIAIFLALALGFVIGPIKLGKFSLGNVTGVLLMGVLIGQLEITISSDVKSVFFLMFLFAVGYGVGPQFFRGLKSDGLPQVLFACLVCVSVLVSAFVAAKIAGYNAGQAAGLLSGAATISAVLGVASDSINNLGLPPDEAKKMIDAMPVAYAVTYLFGTAGSAWFLASMGPKLLRVDLAKECKEYEAKMGGGLGEEESLTTYPRIALRAYSIASVSKYVGKTISDLEKGLAPSRDFAEKGRGPARVFIENIRTAGRILDPDPGMVIQSGDVMAVAAAREVLLRNEADLGPEVDDRELLEFPAEILDVVITNKNLAGKTLQQIAESQQANQNGRGVFLRKLIRGGQDMPWTPGTTVDRGDVLQIVGAKRDLERAVKGLGYVDRPTEKTDVVFMGLGIAIGAVIGAASLTIGGIPLSLSTSGGALIAGLVCGWLRSVHPMFGRIPAPALWAFNNMGLTIFIAVVGITTGPSFVQGLREAGLSLFLWGIFVSVMPFVIGLFAGKYLFKMHPGILLGACAGARTTTAALGAIQDEAKSKVPALGYTITYAVGNTLLIIWGIVIVLMMK